MKMVVSEMISLLIYLVKPRFEKSEVHGVFARKDSAVNA